LAEQADGKILAGGSFLTMGGQSRLFIGRLSSGTAAVQSLTVDTSGSIAIWNRSGPSPEIEQVTFEKSTDGKTYTMLGGATRTKGGWQLSGLSLPAGTNFYLRARGRAAGGYYNASSSLIESVAQLYRIVPPYLAAPTFVGNVFQAVFTNPSLASFTVFLTTNIASPFSTWTALDSPTPIGGGMYRISDPGAANSPKRFYQLRWP